MRRLRPAALGALVISLLSATPAFAKAREPKVLCHYTYGGEEKSLAVTPTRQPYTVEPIALGSYFLLKVVLQTKPRDEAGINIYVYADKEPLPVPLSQARFPFPPRAVGASGYGFTGQHWVYEPIRDGEMQYWCEMLPKGGRK
jgi:hypothetical protein